MTTPTLPAALEAVLLFHSGGPWNDAKNQRWRLLTGHDEATTRVLCDTAREALEAAPKGSGKVPTEIRELVTSALEAAYRRGMDEATMDEPTGAAERDENAEEALLATIAQALSSACAEGMAAVDATVREVRRAALEEAADLAERVDLDLATELRALAAQRNDP